MTATLPALVIAGSCVSRDTYEAQLRDTFRLHAYVARQSLISTMAGPTRLDEPLDLDGLSPFQARMVRGDVASSLLKHVGADAGPGRTILLDIVDERHGVYVLPDGRGYVTRSLELMSVDGLEESVARTARLVPFGSDEHFALWVDALHRFLARVEASPHPSRVVALDVDWALVDEHGGATPASFGVTAREANARQRRYLDELARCAPVRVARLSEPPVAGTDHRWGPAAFHYDAATYERIARAVRACVA